MQCYVHLYVNRKSLVQNSWPKRLNAAFAFGEFYQMYRRFHGRGRHPGSGANAAKFTVSVWVKS